MIRLLIADDHPVVREGLKRLVEAHSDLTVVAEASDGQEVLSRGRAPVDVVLLDVSMPGPGFLEILARLREERPQERVLVLSVHPEEQYAVRALREGAAGYLTKDHSPEKLAEAIRLVHQGHKYVTPSLAERLANRLDPTQPAGAHEQLSTREYQVFCGLSEGRSGAEIGEELSLSPKTVSTYRKRVLEKLNLTRNAELIRYALRHGILPQDPPSPAGDAPPDGEES